MNKKTIILVSLSFLVVLVFVAITFFNQNGKIDPKVDDNLVCKDIEPFFLSMMNENISFCKDEECEDGYHFIRALINENKLECENLSLMEFSEGCKSILKKDITGCNVHEECCMALLNEDPLLTKNEECKDDVLFIAAAKNKDLKLCDNIIEEEFSYFCKAYVLNNFTDYIREYTSCVVVN